MNILVTGADGQLGVEIRKSVNTFGNGAKDHYVGEKNFYIFTGHNDLDITDKYAVESFVEKNFISVIVNCAAYTNVDNAEKENSKSHSTNALGALNLALAAQKVGAVLIHISSDYVFGGFNNTPLQPISQMEKGFVPVDMCDNYYGYTKLVAEDLIEHSGCKYIIIRTSWLYSSHGKNFVRSMYDKCSLGEKVKVVYDQVGSPTSAKDLAGFITSIIERNTSETRYLSKTGIYNYSNKGVTSWYDIAYCIFSVFNLGSNVTPCLSSEWPTTVKRPNYSVFDVSKTEKDFDVDIPNWRTSLFDVISELSNSSGDLSCSQAEKTAPIVF